MKSVEAEAPMITAGDSQTCALATSGGVKCWGNNGNGQLGNNSTAYRDFYSSAAIDVSGLTSGVSADSAGDFHTCAVTTSGGVKCWGANDNGQLGNNSTTDSSNPVDVTGLTFAVTAISAGSEHTCVLTTDRGVKCWGSDEWGQLGNNSNAGPDSCDDRDPCSKTPVDVSGLTSGVTAVSAGLTHTCAVTTFGGVECWGRNDARQLGNNSTTYSSIPVNVSGLTSGVTAISAGGEYTCALTTSGGVKCWGDNYYGQLGNGVTNFRPTSTPVDVSGLTSGVSAISASYSHTCAITTFGGVKCWGDDENGELGNNSTNQSSTPVDVSGLTSGVIAISTGFSHTCAVTISGGVKCWGNNGFGQFGNGTTISSLVPVDTSNLNLLADTLPNTTLISGRPIVSRAKNSVAVRYVCAKASCVITAKIKIGKKKYTVKSKSLSKSMSTTPVIKTIFIPSKIVKKLRAAKKKKLRVKVTAAIS